MLLGFRTIAFKRFPIESVLQMISRLGYDGVELCFENKELNPFALVSEEIERIKGLLKDNSLRISALSLHTDFVENELEFKRVLRGMQITEKFGQKIFIISPGYVRDLNKQAQLKKLKEKLKILLDEAETLDVFLALEAEPGMTIESTEETLNLIEFFESDNLKVNLDIGHSWCIGEPIKSSIMALKDYIVHIHLEDIKDRMHKHIIPGEGDLNIEETLKTLKEISYSGFVTVDLFDLEFPEIAAERSIKYIKALINRLS